MTDELEKQISEEFEKFKSNDYKHEGSQKAYFGGGFKAAALPLMKKIEEFKETPVWLVFENSKRIEKENEELRTIVLDLAHLHDVLDGNMKSARSETNAMVIHAKAIKEIRTKFNLDKEGGK